MSVVQTKQWTKNFDQVCILLAAKLVNQPNTVYILLDSPSTCKSPYLVSQKSWFSGSDKTLAKFVAI